MNRCPRQLVGKPCQVEAFMLGEIDEKCACQSRLNDHSATWRDEDGTEFVMWERYNAHGEEPLEMLTRAREDGLHVAITTESVWYPGHTVARSVSRPTDDRT